MSGVPRPNPAHAAHKTQHTHPKTKMAMIKEIKTDTPSQSIQLWCVNN
jgi:hypothetical protein